MIRDPEAIEKIDDQLRDAAERLTQMKRQVDKDGEANHLDVSDQRSDRPQKMTLAFRTPTANRGAQLLGQYDDVIIEIHKNFMVGIYDRREFRARVKLVGRYVRGAYESIILLVSGGLFFAILASRGMRKSTTMSISDPPSRAGTVRTS